MSINWTFVGSLYKIQNTKLQCILIIFKYVLFKLLPAIRNNKLIHLVSVTSC
jgi:hypothetical protein